MKHKKTKKWIKFRHKIVQFIFRTPFYLHYKRKYNAKIEKFDFKGKNYIVLYNHQTPADQFFLNKMFYKKDYFLGTEDIMSNGFISKLLKFGFAPIPIDKTGNDFNAVKNCIKVVKEGGTILIAPEGNRTYSGHTEDFKPSIIKLIRLCKVPVVLVKIEGGYGVEPRWSNYVRKGEMKIGISKIIEPTEYSKMDDATFLDIIKEGISVDDTKLNQKFTGDKKAEYLERAVCVCPDCGFSELKSEGNFITCQKCGTKVEYKDDLTLSAVKGQFPFNTVSEWLNYQKEFIKNFSAKNSGAIFNDKIRLSSVRLYKSKKLLSKNAISYLFFDKIVLSYNGLDKTILFGDVNKTAVLGRNKLNVSVNGQTYQFKGDLRFNALKYHLFFNNYTTIEEESPK